MSKFIDDILNEHRRIFLENDALLEHFDTLDHRNWEDLDRMLQDKASIIKLGQFFKITNPKSLGAIWFSFKKKVMENSFWCEHKKDKTELFWQSLLLDVTIDVPNNLLQLVKKILVLGISSADAERTFSIMGRIKKKERERCSVLTTEDIIRIVSNGPE